MLLSHADQQAIEKIVAAASPDRRRTLEAFETRRATSAGSFLTRTEWEQMGNPLEVTDVLRRMEGLHFEPGQFGWRWGMLITFRFKCEAVLVMEMTLWSKFDRKIFFTAK